MKQEKGETRSGVSNGLSRWFLTPPARKQSGQSLHYLPLAPLCFYDMRLRHIYDKLQVHTDLTR